METAKNHQMIVIRKPMIINPHNTQIINTNYGIMIQGTGDSIAQLYFICIT